MTQSDPDLHSQQELTRLRAELSRTRAELARVQNDFASFAYAVSHDLQEPLRMVSSYTQLLAKRYAQDLDQSALDFIHYAVDGATRMQTMINDLLTFSRVNTKGQPFEPVDLQAVVRQVHSEQKKNMDAANAVLEFDALPEVWADPGQLKQLIAHLLDNALKFRSQDPPKIRISATTSSVADSQNDPGMHSPEEGGTATPLHQEQMHISVADNGIGIDPKFHTSVFDTFRQLHPRGAYPGSGMGLAICRQIVHRHGGTIWVESEPGQGVTCHVLLPSRPPGLSSEATEP